jgi:uncharacterized membrane-anchored protein YitT (DUF2179 family)
MKRIAFEWYAIAEGCFLVALGLFFLQSSQLLVGGTAGLAVLANHSWSMSMGTWFFMINAPAFLLAIKQLGKDFALKSLACIAVVSVLTDSLSFLIQFSSIPIWLASFIGGGLIGVGLLILFKQNASLGGVNILALFLERKHGIHSGKVILALDMVVVVLGLTIFSLEQLAYSLISFFVLSSVLGRYHKRAPIAQSKTNTSTSGTRKFLFNPFKLVSR